MEIITNAEQKDPKYLQQLIKKETKIEYSLENIRRLLHEFGYSRQKPRPYYINQANKKEVTEFQNETIPYLESIQKEGIPVLVGDEVHVYPDENSSVPVWSRIGEPPRIPYKNRYKSLKYFGVYDTNRKVSAIPYSKGFKAKDFIRCLNRVYTKYGKCIMILDNAKVHKAKIVQEFCEQKGIELIFLPVGRPELSVIEPVWHKLKVKHIHGKINKDIKNLKRRIWYFFKQKFDLDLMSHLKRAVIDSPLQ